MSRLRASSGRRCWTGAARFSGRGVRCCGMLSRGTESSCISRVNRRVFRNCASRMSSPSKKTSRAGWMRRRGAATTQGKLRPMATMQPCDSISCTLCTAGGRGALSRKPTTSPNNHFRSCMCQFPHAQHFPRRADLTSMEFSQARTPAFLDTV